MPHILDRIRHGDRIDNYETTRIKKNGEIIHVSLTVSPIMDLGGHIIGASTIARDMTERKKAEDAIRLANAYNRSLIEASPDPLVTIAPDGRITDVNIATETVTGLSRDRLIGTDFSDYFTNPAKAREGYSRVFEEGSVKDYPLEILHKDGHLMPVLYNASVYRDEAGKVTGVFAMARDITDRKRAEDAFRVASAYNRSLIEASLDPLVTIASDGRITDVNAATEAVTGYSRARLIGTDFSDYFTEPAKAKEGYLTVFEEGSVTDYPLEIRHSNGRVTPVIYNASVYKDETGHVVGVFAAARDITARRKAERAAEAERKRFNDVLNMLPVYVILLTPDHHVPFANDFFEERFGKSHGQRCYEYLFDRTEPCENCESFKALKTGAPHNWKWTGPDGRDYDIFDFPFTDTDGSRMVMEVGIDITERNRAENAFRVASAYNRSLIEASIDPMMTISPDGRITDINKASEAVIGYPRERLIGTDFSDYFTEPAKAREGYQRVFEAGSVTDYPLEIRHRDGHVTPVLYNASIYRDEAGEVIGVFAVARDITERKKAEEAIRFANAYNRSLIEASLDPLVTIAPDGRITDVNRATESVTGYPRDVLIGTDFSNYFTEPAKAKEGYLTVFREGAVTDYPLELRHRDGHITPVIYNASVYNDEAGNIIGVFAAARDITEQKKAEDAFRVASAYNRSLIEASLDPLVTIAPDGRITDVNKSTEAVTGYSREWLIGTDFSDYFTDPAKAREGYLQVFEKGSVTDYPLDIRSKDGWITPVLYNASVYRDEAGNVTGVFAAARDITERKKAEEANARLAAIVVSER